MRKPGAILFEALPHVFKKPATCSYPRVRAQMPDNFRGKLVTTGVKCVGCKACMRDCPAGAITVAKVAEKQFEITIDLARCIYCAQCVDSCPRKVLKSSKAFELASLDRGALKVMISNESPIPASPEPEAPAPNR